jgi:hypothetical protein
MALPVVDGLAERADVSQRTRESAIRDPMVSYDGGGDVVPTAALQVGAGWDQGRRIAPLSAEATQAGGYAA